MAGAAVMWLVMSQRSSPVEQLLAAFVMKFYRHVDQIAGRSCLALPADD